MDIKWFAAQSDTQRDALMGVGRRDGAFYGLLEAAPGQNASGAIFSEHLHLHEVLPCRGLLRRLALVCHRNEIGNRCFFGVSPKFRTSFWNAVGNHAGLWRQRGPGLRWILSNLERCCVSVCAERFGAHFALAAISATLIPIASTVANVGWRDALWWVGGQPALARIGLR